MARVLGIGWLGVRVERVQEMRDFMAETLGLELLSEEHDVAVVGTTRGDRIELFGPAGPQPPEQFSASPVVAGFLVDDIEAVRDRLVAAGVELLGDLGRAEGGYAWQQFRAPDGLVYELTYDPTRAA
jgi:catechol 2,3-dioxygenase-like lactoylglutathione lyase family enzyme